MSKGYLSLRLEQPGERNYRVKIRVQDATNRFIRQRLAISLRQEYVVLPIVVDLPADEPLALL